METGQSATSNFFGKGDSSFGVLSGYDAKYDFDSQTGLIHWKGVSGILQWIRRWPFGFGMMKDGKMWIRLNQVVWNLFIFVLIYGAIYKAMIDNGSLRVPDNMKDGTSTSFTQGVYFSLSTMITLGFGDIVPVTTGAQIMVTSQMILFALFNFVWLLKFEVKAPVG